MNDQVNVTLMVSKTPSSDSHLGFQNSIEDVDSLGSSNSARKKRKIGDESADVDIRDERKAANRRSAYQSRLRKKLLIEELQGKVSELSEQLNTLSEENKSLCYRLESALAENRRLRYVQQESLIMGNAGGVGMNMPGMFPNVAGLGINNSSLSALLAASGKGLGNGFDHSSFSF